MPHFIFKLFVFSILLTNILFAERFNYVEDLVEKKVNLKSFYKNIGNTLDYNLYELKHRVAGSIYACYDIKTLKKVIDYEKNRKLAIKKIEEIENIRPLTMEENQKISNLNINNYATQPEFNSCIPFFDPTYIAVTGEYSEYKQELIAEIISNQESETILYVLAIDLYKAFDLHSDKIDSFINDLYS